VNQSQLSSLSIPGQRWQHLNFSDLDEITEATRDFGFDFVPLEAGPIEATTTRIELDRISLLHGAGTFPRLSVRARSDRAALLVCAGPTDDTIWQGEQLDATSLLALEAGAEVTGSTRGRIAWVARLWDAKIDDEHAAAVGHPTLRLLRTAIGGLVLGDLGAGHWIELTRKDLLGALARTTDFGGDMSTRE